MKTYQLQTKNPLELKDNSVLSYSRFGYTFYVVTKVYMCLVPNVLYENVQQYLSE